MFIDATYEGDLMASAEIKYHIGREPNSMYNEKWNGVQAGIFHQGHHFESKVSPYKMAGDAKSGLLPEISPEPITVKNGTGDNKIQAYCFRMCLSNHPDNRIPFPKPLGLSLIHIWEYLHGYSAPASNYDAAPHTELVRSLKR